MSTCYVTLGFQEFEGFQLIISFIGIRINEKKQEMKENEERNSFLGTYSYAYGT